MKKIKILANSILAGTLFMSPIVLSPALNNSVSVQTKQSSSETIRRDYQNFDGNKVVDLEIRKK